MKAENFYQQYCYNDPMENIFPKGTDAQTCLEILIEHFLGYTPIISYPGHITQWNSEATTLVLEKYPEGKIRKIPKKKKELI